MIEGNQASEFLDETRSFGTRTDQAHVATQDVPKLRELVEPGTPQEFADPRDTGVCRRRPDRSGGPLGSVIHRPEFKQCKFTPILTHARLSVEHGPGRVELYKSHDDQKGGAEYNQQCRRYHKRENPPLN